MKAPEKWTFDAPYTASFNGSGDDTWLGLKSHGMLVASFAVKQWGSEQACIEAAWRHAYEPTADIAPAPVRVKPLVWEQADEGAWLGHGVEPCQYYLRLENELWWHPGEDVEDAEGFPSLHYAKAAAQADYEARILAALKAPDAGVVAELVEALRDLLAAYSKPDERICCNGHECGCQGATATMMAEHYAKEALAKWDAK